MWLIINQCIKMTVLLCLNMLVRRWNRSSQCPLTYTLCWQDLTRLYLINCHVISLTLKLHCVFAGSLSEIKTEADNNDMTEHRHLDTTRPYLCTMCHKRYTTRQNLNMHSKTHTGENVYSCAQCEKRFSSPSGLQTHTNIHAGKYKCTECGRCCLSSKHLAVHRRSHSGEKPFECSVCSRRFIRSSHLVRHSRIHSGEKPYKCHVCESVFRSAHSHESPHGR